MNKTTTILTYNLRLVTLTPLCIWNLVTNSLTLYMMVKTQALRTRPYILVSSLAVVDLMLGVDYLLVMVYYKLNDKTITQIPSQGQRVLCCLSIAMLTFSCMNSFSHVLTISVDRYVAVLYPLQYNTIMTSLRTKIAVLFLWVMTFISAMMMLAWADNMKPYCETSITVVSPQYTIPFVIIPCYIILTGIIVLYLRIFQAARQQLRRITILETMHASLGETKRKLKLIKMFLLLVGVRIVCSLPIITLLTFVASESVDPSSRPMVIWRTIAIFLTLVNSGSNFVVYVSKDSVFRHTLTHLCLGSCTKTQIN